MNEGLQERFGRSRKGFKAESGRAEIWVLPPRLNPKVREYFELQKGEGGSWLDYPEIPASTEVLDINTEGSSTSDVVEISPNRPKGAWESKETYLSAMYELLREDAIRPLREAVSRVKNMPSANEDAFSGAIGIYDNVHICEIVCSSRGIATGVTFSLERTGKKMLWEQSKRLISGGLVVLTPRKEPFQNTAIVATVAARRLEKLEQNPPEIALFIRPEEQEIDPAESYLMVEDRGGLYEASRHTLLALQRMQKEPFPLSDHLVDVKNSVEPPAYLEKHPKLNLTSVLKNNRHETYENVDILNGWPSQPTSDLDASQLAALRRILTKRLAIVQGPPGTGKTFVSTQAIRVLLANRKDDDPPIIIACQTNHAIDQILRHIATFEKEFIRLGGRSKDQEVVKARTLYAVRSERSENPVPGSLNRGARKKMSDLEKEFAILLLPLQPANLPIDFRTLENLGLISQQQANSLEAGAAEWVQGSLSDPKQAQSPFTVWLGKSLVSVPAKQQPEEFGFDFEEPDLEFEQLKEMEAENVAKDDEHIESLNGPVYAVADNFTCSKKTGAKDAKVPEILKEQHMWKIPEADRPAVYRYLQAEMKKIILTSIREKAKAFNKEAARLRIGYWENDEPILKTQKVIGMTTTGLSKYRGLIAALDPKIVLIEEAAETLEAPVTVACLPSVQHLILVGDHQQLRPHCHVKAHEDEPYYLNVSLFERLVNNKIEYNTLSKQRRMIPEIRRLLYPIYGTAIEDHKSVLDPAKRPNVPGMGGVNSFFFSHSSPEQHDDQRSAYNQFEAEMIVKFVEYLVNNGMQTDEITVLTFYNGQRKRILKQLRDCVPLKGSKFTVVTVDSYQGEENKVVLLSLVRNNDRGQIGFLDIVNRVCVALSRAQCGFYIFGNAPLLHGHKSCKIWRKVLKIMINDGHNKIDRLKTEPQIRARNELTVVCSNHNNPTTIRNLEDFDKINGGCSLDCEGDLPCGHPCELRCHPFPHDEVICLQQCIRELSCGHSCSSRCGEACTCKICEKEAALAEDTNTENEPFDGKETLSKASSSGSWQSFAKNEHIRYSNAASSRSHSASPQKKENVAPLLEFQTEEANKGMHKLSLGLDGHVSQTQLVEEKVVANGTRVRRKEKFTSNTIENIEKDKKDWSKEASLLD